MGNGGNQAPDRIDPTPPPPKHTVAVNVHKAHSEAQLSKVWEKRIDFRESSTELTQDAMKRLRDIAQVLAYYPEVGVQIAGYACEGTSQSAVLPLSELRAQLVKEALEKLGVENKPLQVIGKGLDCALSMGAVKLTKLQGEIEDPQIRLDRKQSSEIFHGNTAAITENGRESISSVFLIVRDQPQACYVESVPADTGHRARDLDLARYRGEAVLAQLRSSGLINPAECRVAQLLAENPQGRIFYTIVPSISLEGMSKALPKSLSTAAHPAPMASPRVEERPGGTVCVLCK